MSKRITIKDIAKVSGFSVNCISRALMDAPDISKATKEKVRAIADELGYVYNRSAASLRTGKTKAVGILFNNLLNPFYFIMTNYIWERLNKEDYTIIIFKNYTDVIDEEIMKRIVSNNIDGLLSFLEPSPEAQAMIDELHLPTIVLGRNTHGKCDCIYVSDELGGKLAARNFIERGFKKPVYIGETKDLDCSYLRGKGFADEFEKVGITPDLHYLDSAGFYRYAAYFEKLLQENNLPDCIFCFNDLGAYEIMSAMDAKAIKGIALIGYDDIQSEIHMPGTLTSIGYDKRKMTDCAVDILMNKINGISDGHAHEILIDDVCVSFTKPNIE